MQTKYLLWPGIALRQRQSFHHLPELSEVMSGVGWWALSVLPVMFGPPSELLERSTTDLGRETLGCSKDESLSAVALSAGHSKFFPELLLCAKVLHVCTALFYMLQGKITDRTYNRVWLLRRHKQQAGNKCSSGRGRGPLTRVSHAPKSQPSFYT